MRTFHALLTAVFVLGSAAQAQAACFNFVNGKGPSQIGNVPLYGPATQICVGPVNRFGSRSTKVVFSDSEGELAQFAADVIAEGRCLGYCREMELGYGNADGQNVSSKGTRLSFQIENDGRLGIQKGALTITDAYGQAQRFVVVGAE